MKKGQQEMLLLLSVLKIGLKAFLHLRRTRNTALKGQLLKIQLRELHRHWPQKLIFHQLNIEMVYKKRPKLRLLRKHLPKSHHWRYE